MAGAGQGRQDLQPNMILGIFDDRGRRSLRAGRKAGALPPGAVRRGLHLVRPVLVADKHLLPGARPRAQFAGQPRLTNRALPAALMLKDLKLAQEAAQSAGAVTPLGAEGGGPALRALRGHGPWRHGFFPAIINFLRRQGGLNSPPFPSVIGSRAKKMPDLGLIKHLITAR